MNLEDQYPIFTLDEERYDIGRHSIVEKLMRVMEIKAVPYDEKRLLDLINMQGRMIPIIHIRKILLLTVWKLNITDRIVISSATTDIRAAPTVDRVVGDIEILQA